MSNLTKDEPIMVVSAAGAAVSYVGSALVSHGVLGGAVLSSTEQTVVPIVAAAFVLVLGSAGRALATPYAKVKKLLEREHVLSDADFARIEAVVHTDTGVELDHTDAPDPAPLVDEPPNGMNAGAAAVA